MRKWFKMGSAWHCGIEPELTAYQLSDASRKGTTSCAAQQRQARQTQYYFHNDEADLNAT